MTTNLADKHFDYIIAGSGCAGLSLLYRMLLEPELKHKSILVIDKEKKSKDDRTWCFWEQSDGVFQPVVEHEWNRLGFKSEYFSDTFDIHPYTYKMITGIRFYNFVYAFAANFPNVVFKQERIHNIRVRGRFAEVETKNEVFRATYVFNSTSLFYPKIKACKESLLMHFKGWTIKTKNPAFYVETATLMDFKVNQQTGTAFMYVLPTNTNEALIEYSLINGKTIRPEAYQAVLRTYIKENLQIDDFEIIQEESGVIPMTKKKFPIHHNKRIIHIGTAGGCVKASSGYAFQFIQTHTEKIVTKLKMNQSPIIRSTLKDKKFHLYDKTFLQVLIAKKMSGEKMMALIFKHNQATKVLGFLANESSITDECKLMTTLPAKIFLPTALREVF